MIATSTALNIAGLAVSAIYFILFSKLNNDLTSEEQQKISKNKPAYFTILVMIVFGSSLYLLTNQHARIVISTIVFVYLFIASYLHHRKLKNLGLKSVYLKKSVFIGVLAYIGTFLIIAGFLYG
jgi:hypothetical protein